MKLTNYGGEMKLPEWQVCQQQQMALFGMVWLLRVRAEMRRCAKCRHEKISANPLPNRSFRINNNVNSAGRLDNHYCEIHGYIHQKPGPVRAIAVFLIGNPH